MKFVGVLVLVFVSGCTTIINKEIVREVQTEYPTFSAPGIRTDETAKPSAKPAGQRFVEWMQSLVKVIPADTSYSEVCTGFFVQEDPRQVLTAAHCVKKTKGKSFVFLQQYQKDGRYFNPQLMSATVRAKDPRWDLVALQMREDRPTFNAFPTGNAENVQIFDKLFALGFPFGEFKAVELVVIGRAINKQQVAMIVQSTEDLSHGSPVITENEEVIGVVQEKIVDPQRTSNLFLVIPFDSHQRVAIVPPVDVAPPLAWKQVNVGTVYKRTGLINAAGLIMSARGDIVTLPGMVERTRWTLHQSRSPSVFIDDVVTGSPAMFVDVPLGAMINEWGCGRSGVANTSWEEVLRLQYAPSSNCSSLALQVTLSAEDHGALKDLGIPFRRPLARVAWGTVELVGKKNPSLAPMAAAK